MSTMLTGTPSQIEWAGRIKLELDAEFDRIAASLRSCSGKQSESRQAATQAIIGILEEKRAEVMLRDQAGYFIRYWQEIGDRVRRMVLEDDRYQAIRDQGRKEHKT